MNLGLSTATATSSPKYEMGTKFRCCDWLEGRFEALSHTGMSCIESSYLRGAMALSAAGMCVVPVFGLLLRTQPEFVHGLHVNASSAEINCYIVGGLYAGVFLVCGLLLALKTRGCFDKKQDETRDDATKRNGRYGLQFQELESEEFVKAMEAMDRRTAVSPTPDKKLELPTKYQTKIDAM